jgi:hypothetical protein
MWFGGLPLAGQSWLAALPISPTTFFAWTPRAEFAARQIETALSDLGSVRIELSPKFRVRMG